MEIAITTMSQNGQIVIPADIRKDAGLNPFTKFIVFNRDGNILLKQLHKDDLSSDMELIEKISRSESLIKSGKVIKTNPRMSDKEIDALLMKK